jgi:hypothetical protein
MILLLQNNVQMKKWKRTSDCRYHPVEEQGFALPAAIGIGLVVMLVGVTMVVRSQADRSTAIAQKATADSLSVSEAGITRILALLKKYPALAAQSATTWPTSTSTMTTSAAICGGSASTSTPTTEESKLITRSRSAQWLNINDTDVEWRELGEFRVVSYEPNTPTAGTSNLVVEGRARSENNAATTTSSTTIGFGNSTTALSVQFPITGGGSAAGPGIWVIGTSTPIDVSTDGTINASVCVLGTSFDSGKISVSKLEQTGSNPKPIYDGKVPSVTAAPGSPIPLPAPPATAYRLPPLDLSNCYIVLPRIPTASRTNGLTGTNCSVSDKFGTPYPNTFNVTTDTPTGGVYSYLIDSTTSGSSSSNSGDAGGDSIKLSNSGLIIDPPTGTKVVLYVRGNVSISGTSGGSPANSCVGTSTPVTSYINGYSPTNTSFQNTTDWKYDTTANAPPSANNTGLASNLEIYGADGSGGTWGTGYKMENFQVTEATMVTGFLYVPKATVDGSQAEIRGTVWSEVFKSSNSSGCRRAMVQASVGDTRVPLPSSTISIGSIKSWRRQEAQ